MISIDDSYNTLEFKNYFIILPSISLAGKPHFNTNKWGEKGTPKKYGFVYSSDKNDRWLTPTQLKEKITQID